MLNRDINRILFDESGRACGVQSGNEIARAKMVVGDPSYFPSDKIRPTGKVVRCICFLNHCVPNTNNNECAQIIIPGPQVGRNNDIFICVVSSSHAVSARGIYIAIVSTKVETDNPEDEISPGLHLLGHILQRFIAVTTTYEPISDGSYDRCYI